MSKKTALGFTQKPNKAPEEIPVLFEIQFSGQNQFFFMENDQYSAYPEEREVLLQDGLEYDIIDVFER